MGVGGSALKGPGAAGSRAGCSGGQPVPSSRGPSLEEPWAWFVLWNLLQPSQQPRLGTRALPGGKACPPMGEGPRRARKCFKEGSVGPQGGDEQYR